MRRLRLVVIGLVATAAVLAGQTRSRPAAEDTAERRLRQSMQQAKQARTAGQYVAAQRALESALESCDAGDRGQDCRRQVVFSKAWTAQQQGVREKEPAKRQELLQDAANSYEAVLREAPDDAATLRNLAIVSTRLGDTGRAMRALETAVEADRSKADQYSVMLGDLHAARGELTAARQRYESAIEANPDTQVGRQRLIAAYRNNPDANPADLIEKLNKWKTNYPEVVADGYLWVMNRTYENRPELAEEALVQWVDVLAAAGTITVESLAELPKEWDSAPARGLRAYLEEPRRPPESQNWWLQDDRRRNVLSRAALALGHNWQVTRGMASWSARCWGSGLEFAPPYDAYRMGELGDEKAVRLDLQTSLASLYFKNEDLDPGGRRFLALEEQLFLGKGEAYRFNDWEAVQAHHVKLGEIYAERGWWETSDRPRGFGGNRFTNAFFQLEAALRAARTRSLEYGVPYQPLADIKNWLGEGYAQKEQLEQAQRHYLAAAEAYLDADLVQEARSAMVKADRMEVEESSGIQRKMAFLRRLYIYRRDAGNPESDLAAAVVRGPNPVSREAASWLYSDESPFLERQRFKLAADLASLSHAAAGDGDSFRSSTAFARAFELALQAVEQATQSSITLIGAGDLRRLRLCQQIVEEGARMRPAPAEVKLGEPSRKAVGTALGFSLPGAKQDSFVDVPDDTLLAVRVFREVEFASWLRWNARLVVRDGNARMVVDPEVGRTSEVRRIAKVIADLSA